MRGPFLALFFFVALARAAKPTVPGCPSIDVLENDDKIDENSLKNLLLCFCQVYEQSSVAISCLYGSNPDHLKRATDAVEKANMTTKIISIQHMEFPESGLPDLAPLAPQLTSLEIRECSSAEPLEVSKNVFVGLEDNLRNLTIHGCGLMEVPVALNDLRGVTNLDLSGNKLQSVSPLLFADKKELKYLDISNNQIGSLEEGSFAPLEQLETLVAGDHNYMNESVYAEIALLKNLKTLDLSRADGLFEPPMEIFGSLANLEELKLSGCSIPRLEPGMFSPLKNLKQLDLRVNLIENVSVYAFDGLDKLERLTLAGNYIRDIEKDVWSGLHSLKELDMGWNEIKKISPESLSPLKDTLKTLNLRHNPITSLSPTSLVNLENLLLSECELEQLEPAGLEEYTKLQKLDLSHCNLTSLPADIFKAQANSLKSLNLAKNHFKRLPAQILKDLPLLEEFDISGNPYLCDDHISDLVSAVDERYKQSAKEGKDFLLANGNETLCARPYTLKGQAVLELEPSKLQPYDENLDTTTTTTEATTAADDNVEPTTQFTLPNLFVGAKNNDTLFKEEPRRDVYDLQKYDNPRNGKEDSGALTLPVTLGILGLVSVIALVAVVLFMRKRKKAATNKVAPDANGKKSPAVMEDGMEEIELNTRP